MPRPPQAWDYIALTGTTEQRVVEWVDHLHQHFIHPPRVEAARWGCNMIYYVEIVSRYYRYQQIVHK